MQHNIVHRVQHNIVHEVEHNIVYEVQHNIVHGVQHNIVHGVQHNIVYACLHYLQQVRCAFLRAYISRVAYTCSTHASHHIHIYLRFLRFQRFSLEKPDSLRFYVHPTPTYSLRASASFTDRLKIAKMTYQFLHLIMHYCFSHLISLFSSHDYLSYIHYVF